jgi:small subunit ribosomal protein S9
MTAAEKKAPAKKTAAHKAAPKKRAAAPKVKKAEKPVVETLPEVTPEEQPTPVVTRTAVHGSHYAVGRRKRAVAQVTVSTGDGKITVNQLTLEGYFGTPDLHNIVLQPLNAIGMDKHVSIRAKVHGGGIHAQAESMRHAIARALILIDPESRRTLKKLGFLTRDSRIKERKKPGLKRARRAPQFSKR